MFDNSLFTKYRKSKCVCARMNTFKLSLFFSSQSVGFFIILLLLVFCSRVLVFCFLFFMDLSVWYKWISFDWFDFIISKKELFVVEQARRRQNSKQCLTNLTAWASVKINFCANFGSFYTQGSLSDSQQRKHNILTVHNKKLSYCWETVRRESMPRIAKMDVEMTT